MPENPSVSFIVTTFKRPEKLLRCLLSIKEVMLDDYEIIVLDDSQDGEGFAPATAVAAHYIKKPLNARRGPAASRNIGILHAKAEFVVFIDDDDFFINSDLQFMISSAGDNDFVFCNYYQFDGTKMTQRVVEHFTIEAMLIQNMIPIGSFAVRRDAIRAHFDEDLRSHEDWDFFLRNMFFWKLRYFNLSPVVIEKSDTEKNTRTKQTEDSFWIDYLSIYARFPCPRLASERSAALAQLGLIISPDALMFDASVNQITY